MPRTDKFSHGLVIYKLLIEANPFNSLGQGHTNTDHAILITDTYRDMRNLKSPCLTRLYASAEHFECFKEKPLDMMRLQALRFRTLHL